MFIIKITVFFSSIISIFFSLFLFRYLMKFPTGNTNMLLISSAIEEGAIAYLNRQYTYIFYVGIVISFFLYFLMGIYSLIGFIIGAVFSSFAGYFGMLVSVRSNIRTTEAANHGISKSFFVAFKSGFVIGLFVIGLGLFGISTYYFFLLYIGVCNKIISESLISLSFGASLISVFARLGGGIFTKGADIGADLVGKIEAGIPEDDYRNPAVIADNVGDNVGDCAGMSADLFETYVVTIATNIVLINIFDFDLSMKNYLLLYPLVICSISILSTIAGVYKVKFNEKIDIMKSLYRSFIFSSIFSGIFIIIFTYYLFDINKIIIIGNVSINGLDIILCSLIGLFITFLFIIITEYYTSHVFWPVKSIANSSIRGHATNIIQGLSISMRATFFPIVVICSSIFISYNLCGILGIAFTATSMLSMSGIIITLDAYGPITDNAGGIAEMAKLDKKVRINTDKLDAVGNTTKAVTKGYAIGSAVVASLILFTTYIEDIKNCFPSLKLNFSLHNEFVIIGLFIGGVIPYIFSSYSMTAVGQASEKIVDEVRRQFREIKGIMTGEVLPKYGLAVDLLTKVAVRKMIFPSLLPVFSPIIVYLIVLLTSGNESALTCVGSMLLGSVVTGFFIAVSMTSGGGAWDNAKKFIEMGNLGGKKSKAHQASITGDTVGDPCKDTAGPAINPLIKLINIISILLLSVIYNVC